MSDKKRILLIDDEASERESMRGILQGDSYTVLEAADYDEAVAVHQQHPGEINILLIDVALPGKNGYELARTLLKTEPNLEVIFMSGHAGSELSRFYGMPVTDVHFLEKPFQAVDLLQRVKCVSR